ncbi:TPA: hypothetical protein N0F65_005451 [Lagenidium giganteum]|uniref:Phosphorylated adapter RNA export protein n=1 Tax=Lagenidium giganteum TaxID=4803 RepID=A0AAV2Z113_9STRA|nr:TPA: hypothetical protein N0F65_005451 [Lagenidium giganteum]
MPSAADMPRVMAQLLREKKQALLHRVVRIVGPKISWKVLQETLRREREGGMEVNAFESGAPGRFLVVDEQTKELKPRRRTTGGVFFTLLREHVSKEEYRQIYEEEVKKKRELKNKIKFQRRQRTEKELSALGFDDLAIAQEADALGVTQDHVPSAGTSLCEDELDHAMLSCEEGEVDAATAPIDTVSDPTAIASI